MGKTKGRRMRGMPIPISDEDWQTLGGVLPVFRLLLAGQDYAGQFSQRDN